MPLPGRHAPVLVQVRPSSVVVVAAVLSRSVTVAQSYVTVSGQWMLYQKLSVAPPEGAPNVCWMEESPLVGELLPTEAE